MIEVKRSDLEAGPHTLWNAWIGFLASADPARLSAVEAPAYLGFRYESEVQNGGHLQMFVNQGLEFAEQTLEALPKLGAAAFSPISNKR
jgi:hypothetical protein